MPHNLLEKVPELDQYLSTLGKEIKDLPAVERDSVHEELRQHLDAMIAAEEELGAAQAVAIESALASFGDAKTIGRRLRIESEKKLVTPQMRQAMSIVGTVLLAQVFLVIFGGQLFPSPAHNFWFLLITALAVGIYVERRYPDNGLEGTMAFQLITQSLLFLTTLLILCPIGSVILDGPGSSLLGATMRVSGALSLQLGFTVVGVYFANVWRMERGNVFTKARFELACRRLAALRHGTIRHN
jgi:hypothetical protein